MKTVLLTGYRGFIGQYVLRELLAHDYRVFGVDSRTYAAHLSPLKPTYDIWQDINDLTHLPMDCDLIVNLAAETHVDNSITDPTRFTMANYMGVARLLELIRGGQAKPRFVQISTDEVYGECVGGSFDENAPLRPGNPYAASKAAADLLIQAYARTFGFPYQIIRPSNCYGLGQYPEKLIPKALRCWDRGESFPLHQRGAQERSWLHVEDAASAIRHIIEQCPVGSTWNIPGNCTLSVGSVLALAWDCFQQERPQWQSFAPKFTYVDRPGQDSRYKVSGGALTASGWSAQHAFADDLPGLVRDTLAQQEPRW